MSPVFRELPPPVALEEEVLRFWEAQGIFRKSLEKPGPKGAFVFYEGPPTANGTPHNGHVLTRVIKDLFPRYKTMRGYTVPRKAGWDTHGLPVEIEVEKELGMREDGAHRNARDAVLAYGLDNFAYRCMESVFKYTEEWRQLTDRVGFWVDMGDAYVTYHKPYVESVWWALKQLFDRGLLYQGLKVVWWWPEGGTALSSGEVGEGYRDVDDPSVTIRFPVEGQAGTSFLAWTTTPWTLPSNVALTVHPDLDYAYTQVGDEVFITAAALAPPGERLRTVPGRELVGLRYTPPFRLAADPGGRAFVVVDGRHVTTDAGTGVVHTAPAYGVDDHEMRVHHGLGILHAVGPDGRVSDLLPEGIRGLHFKEADKPILRDLKERGLVFHSGTIRHSYPFSPRAKDDPLMQLARPGWFIRTTAFKDEALANNAAVRWLPEHIQDGRFGDFLRNNVDWALSRERFWGTPLPIWSCASCHHREAYDSLAALEAAGAQGIATDVPEHLRVHRPWVDRITVPCARCGGTMHRAPEVIDCWFDSGCMPFAQWGFPHQGVEAFRSAFPADFISEAVDQTRGWFYSLLMISTMLFDAPTRARFGLAAESWPRPFQTCIVLGHVCDMDGNKESKSKGNYTSPHLVLRGRMQMRVVRSEKVQPGEIGMGAAAVRSIDLGPGEALSLSAAEDGAERANVTLVAVPYPGKETALVHPETADALGLGAAAWVHAPFQPPGADAFRWLFYASSPPWTNTRLSLRAIREGQREFHLRLGNVFQFFSIYANISQFDPEAPRPRSAHLLDRWVRSEAAALVESVTAHLDGWRAYEAARALSAFVDGLSNWYVRRSRARFWGEGADTAAALGTLYDVLVVLSRLMAPFVPFMAEAMHQRLGRPGGAESVHLCDWPSAAAEDRDDALVADMALVREVVSLGLSARKAVGVRVRQPLRAAELILADATAAARLEPLLGLVQDELNVRAVHPSTAAERFVTFTVKANFARLGKRLGKDMKACAAALQAADPAAVRRGVLAGGYGVALPGGEVVLTEEDVLVGVEPKAGFQAAGSAAAVVVLHADLDDDLREEGLYREVLNRVQGRRKDLGLGYTDRIRVAVTGSAALVQAVQRFAGPLAQEALAVGVSAAEGPGVEEVDGHAFQLEVARA